MDVVKERAQLYIRISDLLAKPHRTRDDEITLDNLQRALKDSLMQMGHDTKKAADDGRSKVHGVQ